MTWNRIETFTLIITTITNGNNITKKIKYKVKIIWSTSSIHGSIYTLYINVISYKFSQSNHISITKWQIDVIPEKYLIDKTVLNRLFQKNSEETACRNSKGQLKKKWNFQEGSRKTHVEFPWVLASVWPWISKVVSHTAQFCFVQCVTKLVFSWISKRVKWQI